MKTTVPPDLQLVKALTMLEAESPLDEATVQVVEAETSLIPAESNKRAAIEEVKERNWTMVIKQRTSC